MPRDQEFSTSFLGSLGQDWVDGVEGSLSTDMGSKIHVSSERKIDKAEKTAVTRCVSRKLAETKIAEEGMEMLCHSVS